MNQTNTTKFFQSDKPIYNILAVSFPIMLAQFILTLNGFISAFILSFISLHVFSASMLISAIQLVISVVPFSLLYCLSPVISQLSGNKQIPSTTIGIFFKAGILLSLSIAVIIMLILTAIKPILLYLEQPQDLVDICQQYFKYFLWGIPATAIIQVCFQFALGIFQQRLVLLFSILSVILSTLLSYLLVFGKLGLPIMGVQGVSLAFITQAYFIAGIFLAYLAVNKAFVSFKLLTFSSIPVDALRNSCKKIVAIGSPIVIQTGNELLSFLATTMIVGWLGLTALIAKQIVVRYLLLVVIPLFGISQASSICVGKFLGEQRYSSMKRYGNISIMIGLTYSLIVVAIFTVIPKPLINLFLHNQITNPAFLNNTTYLLIIVSIGQVFDAVRNITTGNLRGLNDTRYPMGVSLLLIWPIGLPLAYLFGITFQWNLIGIAIANNLTIALAATLLFLRWKKQSDKLSTVQSVDQLPQSGLDCTYSSSS